MMTGSFFFFKDLKKKIKKKGGGSLIRACSLIRSNTVSHSQISLYDMFEINYHLSVLLIMNLLY